MRHYFAGFKGASLASCGKATVVIINYISPWQGAIDRKRATGSTVVHFGNFKRYASIDNN